MSPLVLFVLGVAGGLCLVAHLGLFLAAYAPVRRRARAWTANPPSMVAFQENNLGIDPDAAYLYAAFDVGTDDALVVPCRAS